MDATLGTQVYALDWTLAGGMTAGLWDDCLRVWRAEVRPRRFCAAFGDAGLVLLVAVTLLASLYLGNWLAWRLYAVVGGAVGYAVYRSLGSPFLYLLLAYPWEVARRLRCGQSASNDKKKSINGNLRKH